MKNACDNILENGDEYLLLISSFPLSLLSQKMMQTSTASVVPLCLLALATSAAIESL